MMLKGGVQANVKKFYRNSSFFFSFSIIVAVPTLNVLMNIMNYGGLMDY